jgi:hypothetical protein
MPDSGSLHRPAPVFHHISDAGDRRCRNGGNQHMDVLFVHVQAGAVAESMRKALYYATYELASYKIRPDQDINDTIKPDKNDVNALVDHLQQEGRFWSALEIPFYELLMTLPSNSEAVGIWQEVLVRTAKESLTTAAELAGDDYAGLKARAKAENKLGTEIFRILYPDGKEK